MATSPPRTTKPLMKFLREISSFDSVFLTGVMGREIEGDETTGRGTAEAALGEPTDVAGLGADPNGVPTDDLDPTGVPIVGLATVLPTGVPTAGLATGLPTGVPTVGGLGAGVAAWGELEGADGVPIGVPIFGRPIG